MLRSRRKLEYVADEGFVRLNLRRPVNLYLPSDVEDYDPYGRAKKPKENLQLEWVYGYRGRDSRNNIRLLDSNEVVYFVASAAVIAHVGEKTQRHYVEHTDDIKCVAVHPEKKIVATGQVQGRGDIQPHIRVWDSETLETLQEFGGDDFKKGVVAAAFSHDGELLAAVDDSPEPRLSLWEWQSGEKLAEVKASADPILGVTFSKESPSRIVTNGKNHLAFWTINDNNLEKKQGIFGSHERPKYVSTVTSLNSGEIVTGDSNGNILMWKTGGNTVFESITPAHNGGVFYVLVTDEGKMLSAGKDRKIVTYDESFQPVDSVEIPEEFGTPRVALWVGDDIIAGTTTNVILKPNAEDEPDIITRGHLEELWGLAIHPSEPHFITAGQDSHVHLRNYETHDIIWSKKLEPCQSAGFSPRDSVVIVGTLSGNWFTFDLESQEKLFEGKNGDEPIQVVRFSPSGEKLALGSRDNSVYVYQVEENGQSFSKIGACEGHSSFITHLDWSADNQTLRTNSGDYEVLFWNTENCSQLTQSEDTKDIEWATNTCILSFHSVGIWPPGTDGTDINSACKANDKQLLASGDDFGHVKLFQFPAITENAPNKSYIGHSSHVTCVCFSKDDAILISAGGRDTAALQWKLIEEDEE